MRLAGVLSVLLVIALLSAGPHGRVHAQTSGSGQAGPSVQPRTTAGPAIPSDNQIATLIISTLIALNHANYTGNYGVLRELASPNFQAANNSGRLSEIFEDLRNKRFDFSPIILLQPKLLRPPAIDANSRLRITGYFETAPERLNFDLLYEPVGGRWRLFGIAANTSPADAPAVQKSPARP
ncbi:MAG: hypothetical protein QNJ62_08530 [Methyloceanibacter sp.]|nr:hypothetical protein [Methyloceanibacter sp.]